MGAQESALLPPSEFLTKFALASFSSGCVSRFLSYIWFMVFFRRDGGF